MISRLAHSTRKEAGLTLVELLISTTISAFLIAGMLQMMAASRISETLRDQLALVLENGRYTMHMLTDAIRMAGYMGCQDSSEIGFTLTQQGEQFISTGINRLLVSPESRITPLIFGRTSLFDVVIEGVEGNSAGNISLRNWNEQTPLLVAPVVTTNSDVLITQHADYVGAAVTAISDGAITTANTNIKAGELSLVTDCLQADLFKVSAVEPTTLRLSPNDNISTLPQNFAAKERLTSYGFRGNAFFVGYLNDDPQNTPVLYKTNLHSEAGGKEIVAEGIENLQLQYGVLREEGATMDYIDAHQLHLESHPLVSTVTVSLLVRSLQPVRADPVKKIHDLQGTTIETNDRYAHGVFTQTINLRNHRIIQKG